MEYHSKTRRLVFRYLPETMDTVLDVGGGYGNTAAAVKEEFGARRVGVIDAVATEGDRNPALDFALQGNIEDPAVLRSLCEKEGPFSVILCLDVLEHLVDPWACINILQDHLAEDGILIATIPNVANASVVIRLALFGSWRLQDSGIMDRTHLRFFTRETSKELLECGKLKIDAVAPVFSGHTPFRQLRFLRYLIGERWFVAGYLLRARRS